MRRSLYRQLDDGPGSGIACMCSRIYGGKGPVANWSEWVVLCWYVPRKKLVSLACLAGANPGYKCVRDKQNKAEERRQLVSAWNYAEAIAGIYEKKSCDSGSIAGMYRGLINEEFLSGSANLPRRRTGLSRYVLEDLRRILVSKGPVANWSEHVADPFGVSACMCSGICGGKGPVAN